MDFCLVCEKEIPKGEAYCSPECQMKDMVLPDSEREITQTTLVCIAQFQCERNFTIWQAAQCLDWMDEQVFTEKFTPYSAEYESILNQLKRRYGVD